MIEINKQSMNKYCMNVMQIRDFFLDSDFWPVPFPPNTGAVEEESGSAKDRGKRLNSISNRLPMAYADRLIFTYGMQATVNRFLFPWIPWVNYLADDLLYFEVMLHMEPEEAYYRDHYVHPLEVGCIGEQLINEAIFNGATLEEKLIDSFQKIIEGEAPNDPSKILRTYLRQCNIRSEDIDGDWIKAAWWTCAMYHDIGYFIQKSGHFLDERIRRSFPFAWNRAMAGGGRREWGDDLVWRQVEAWVKEKNKNAEYYKYFKAFTSENLLALITEEDHPGIGALTLSALSRKALQHKPLSPRVFCALQTASHAVFFHDHMGLAKCLHKRWDETYNNGKPRDEPIYHLDYWANPLAALLVVCDHISEFNRERLKPTKSGDNTEILFKSVSFCEGVDIKIEDSLMNIHFKPVKGKKKDLFDAHFKEDKQWFLPCSQPGLKTRGRPYLRLDQNEFEVLVHLN